MATKNSIEAYSFNENDSQLAGCQYEQQRDTVPVMLESIRNYLLDSVAGGYWLAVSFKLEAVASQIALTLYASMFADTQVKFSTQASDLAGRRLLEAAADLMPDAVVSLTTSKHVVFAVDGSGEQFDTDTVRLSESAMPPSPHDLAVSELQARLVASAGRLMEQVALDDNTSFRDVLDALLERMPDDVERTYWRCAAQPLLNREGR